MSWLALSAIFVSEWARAVRECGGGSLLVVVFRGQKRRGGRQGVLEHVSLDCVGGAVYTLQRGGRLWERGLVGVGAGICGGLVERGKVGASVVAVRAFVAAAGRRPRRGFVAVSGCPVGEGSALGPVMFFFLRCLSFGAVQYVPHSLLSLPYIISLCGDVACSLAGAVSRLCY